jgi:hypothetical protein
MDAVSIFPITIKYEAGWNRSKLAAKRNISAISGIRNIDSSDQG